MTDLPAGRELDALVAEKVMGWTVSVHDIDPPHYSAVDPSTNTYHGPLPEFSTDIAAAWTVVEKLFADGVADTVHVWKDGAIFLNDREPVSQHGEGPAPLAICRAALKAISGSTQGTP